MLTFCTWKDEDGNHYGVTNKHPKAYFKWHDCHLCNPKSCTISSRDCERMIVKPQLSVVEALKLGFIEVEIDDWSMYFDIKPRLKSIF